MKRNIIKFHLTYELDFANTKLAICFNVSRSALLMRWLGLYTVNQCGVTLHKLNRMSCRISNRIALFRF